MESLQCTRQCVGPILTSILAICVITRAAPAGDIKIEGKVTTLDRNGKYVAIKNVTVMAWRGNRPERQMDLTDDDGEYEVKITEGRPVDSVTFSPRDGTQFGPATVDNLSGEDDHRIGTVLYDRPTLKKMMEKAAKDPKANIGPYWKQLEALERIYMLERGRGTQHRVLERRYGGFIKAIVPDAPPPAKDSPFARAIDKARRLRKAYSER